MVRELGMPFREAHFKSGKIVAAAESKGIGLEDMSLAPFSHRTADQTRYNRPLSVASAVTARKNTADRSNEVRARIADARQRFAIC